MITKSSKVDHTSSFELMRHKCLPGAIAFTLIECFAHSLAKALVTRATPPLAAAYAGTRIPP